MVRRRRQEIQVNHERWLISYADFITLLFAFFVVMYSISQVNDSKYRVLSETFVEAFNLPKDTQAKPDPVQQLSPSNDPIAPLDLGKTAAVDPLSNGLPAVISNPQSSALSSGQEDVQSTGLQTSDELTQISDLVSEKFEQLIKDEMIQVSSNELWLQIALKDSILFESGNTEPSNQALIIFNEIAAILTAYNNPVQVEGFTDNVPIKSIKYPTNWELSTARASAIVKVLASEGIAPERLAAVGYGEYQPVASNDTEQGRAQNRRVAIMVAKRKMERPSLNIQSPTK
jgi:chemotaxis protein MotB